MMDVSNGGLGRSTLEINIQIRFGEDCRHDLNIFIVVRYGEIGLGVVGSNEGGRFPGFRGHFCLGSHCGLVFMKLKTKKKMNRCNGLEQGRGLFSREKELGNI